MTKGTRPCLVVIEDNPADVQLLELALADAGLDCEFTFISDGRQAMDWVHLQATSPDATKPGVIVLDLNLPKHDGIEILEAMHRTGLGTLPVLVLSSSPSPRDAARVTAFPNARYMTKPVDLDGYATLSAVLRQMIEQPSAAAR